jgi:hypothetical protein
MPEFYLSVLDASFTSIKATLEGKTYDSVDVSASIYVDITKSDIRSLFQYDSSNSISNIGDLSADDLRYYVNKTKWPASNSGAVISDVSLNENTNLNLKSDFISYLAKQLFKTERGVDLFNNEDALLTDFKSNCDTFWNNLKTNYITKIDKTIGDHLKLVIDENSRKYLTNNTATKENLTRELLLQVIDASKTRFSDIQTFYDNTTGLYAVPFEAGDKVSFILTVHSDSTQTSVIGETTPSAVNDRIYKISLRVTA